MADIWLLWHISFRTMKLTPSILLSGLLIFCFISCSLLGLLFLLLGVLGIEDGSTGLGIFAILLMTGTLSLNWLLWKSTKDKIQFASLDNEVFNMFRPLSGERIKVKIDKIKGYSKSLDDKSYGTTLLKRNCLTIYFIDDLAPVEFVQYQVSNLKGLEEELNRLKIDFLGDEEIYRDGFGRRTRFVHERYEPQQQL